jgi:hypothetical protein
LVLVGVASGCFWLVWLLLAAVGCFLLLDVVVVVLLVLLVLLFSVAVVLTLPPHSHTRAPLHARAHLHVSHTSHTIS